jgi:hypothetical protein
VDQNVAPYRGVDGSRGTEINYVRLLEGDIRKPLLKRPLARDRQSRFVDIKPSDPAACPHEACGDYGYVANAAAEIQNAHSRRQSSTAQKLLCDRV